MKEKQGEHVRVGVREREREYKHKIELIQQGENEIEGETNYAKCDKW